MSPLSSGVPSVVSEVQRFLFVGTLEGNGIVIRVPWMYPGWSLTKTPQNRALLRNRFERPNRCTAEGLCGAEAALSRLFRMSSHGTSTPCSSTLLRECLSAGRSPPKATL